MAENLAVKVGRLEERMEHVEAAVANFRSLDRNVSEFMTEFRTHRNDEEDAAKRATEAVKVDLEAHNRKADRRINTLIAICAIITLFFGLPAVIHTAIEVRKEILTNQIQLPHWPQHTGQIDTAHSTPREDTLMSYPKPQ
jgi:hypothetical protein